MSVIVMGGEKGGVGKTALSTNLAVCLAARGRDVLLVDADPQRSAAKWAARRAKLEGADQRPHVNWTELGGRDDESEDLFSALQDFAGRYEDLVVDVGGALSADFISALAVADKLVSPLVPSDCDLATLGDLDELVGKVRAMGNRALEPWVVLNHCPTHTHNTEVEEALAEIAELDHLMAMSSTISHRRSFRDAYKHRLGVVELLDYPNRRVREAAPKAAMEVWSLYAEITGDTIEYAVGDKVSVARASGPGSDA